MPKFRTHLIINKRDSDKIKALSFNNIKLDLLPEPSKCYWESLDGRSSSISYGGRDPETIREDEIPLNELIIEAATEEVAEDFISILQGGMLLVFPDASIIHKFIFITEYDESRNKLYTDEHIFSYLKKFDNVSFGCLIAQKIIRDNQLVYAIEKYKTSIGLTSFNPYSADPMYGKVFDNYDFKREYHTKAAFAIIAAFSVIEELGLEIRSSQKRPRFLNSATGEWNPDVLLDVQERLNESNISDRLTFDWVYRGDPTRIEKEIKPYFGFDSEWTKYGEAVRDKTLTIAEAVHNASYLRNFIAAHKFNELTQYISPYDVFNVQSLGRKLILNKLNLWQAMLDRNK
ncbi:hypothetical protein [Spirosoma rigui]|uniref:hypothetical protein n=1 Tax=Spirosoma rigui TaxID=564064 RepID=UPI0012D2C687|nr:hypothetical protein [Spirosoma rigui]